MTAGDIIVLAVLGAVVVFIIGKLRKDRKKGHCCGSCEGCNRCGAHTER